MFLNIELAEIKKSYTLAEDNIHRILSKTNILFIFLTFNNNQLIDLALFITVLAKQKIIQKKLLIF